MAAGYEEQIALSESDPVTLVLEPKPDGPALDHVKV